MRVESILVVQSDNARTDELYLKVNLPPSRYPTVQPSVRLEVQRGRGLEYCWVVFPGVPTDLIQD